MGTGLAPHHPTISQRPKDGHLHVHGAGWSRRRAALHLQPRIGLQGLHHRADGALVMGWGCELGDLWDNYCILYYINITIYNTVYLYYFIFIF